MNFSTFTKISSGNLIYFRNETPIENVGTLKFYTDNASGTFLKKEFRWSFDRNYWSSWETLNIGNIAKVNTGNNRYLFFEIKYTMTSPTAGRVTSFAVEYIVNPNQTYAPAVEDVTNIDDNHILPDGCNDLGGTTKTSVGLALAQRDVSTLMKGPFTLSMWFYPNDLGVGAQYLFLINAKKWNCSGTPLWLGTEGLSIAENITGSGVVNLNTLEVAEGSPCGYTLTELAGKLDGLSIKNNWHNIIFSMEANGTYHVFFDLQELYYYKSARTITGFDSSTMLIRTAVDQGWPFEGCIDQLQIFDRVLTSDERYLLFHGFDVI